jgi:hypothetical protein
MMMAAEFVLGVSLLGSFFVRGERSWRPLRGGDGGGYLGFPVPRIHNDEEKRGRVCCAALVV